ncbi:MAG: prephenate dehydrogenase [Methanobacteriaceae archaeon]|nr:prephenate dehydrogenase [Methanobacteriaceae archaeon]
MRIGIIGGTKGLGKTLAWYFKEDNFDVTITGRDTSVGDKVSEELGVNYSNDNIETVKNSDIVIISVPISSTEGVIKELAKYMPKDSLMIDVTSVKEGPSYCMNDCLKENTNGGVEFIPTHPVFGPRTTSLDGQVIVLTPISKGKWYPKVYKYLSDKKMRIIETSPKHHDNMMGIVQVLTHFSYISTASAIEKLKINIKDTEDYESPIYNLMIDTIARIVSQNPYLTYSIQHENKSGEKIRQAFAESVNELKEVLTAEDEDKFVDIAITATKHMGDIQNALGRSDKAINSLTQEFNTLRNSVGEEIGLEHIYSGKVHIGVLEEINTDSLKIKSSKMTKSLKIANVRILSKEEILKWKIANQKIYNQSISCVFPNTSDSEIIKNTLSNVEEITDVKITDIYNGPQIKENHSSYTFEVSGLSNKAIENCKTLIQGFGGLIR